MDFWEKIKSDIIKKLEVQIAKLEGKTKGISRGKSKK